MDANWRRDAIVELLRQKGKVKARELAKRFHVTRQTICQDITVLSLHCDIYTERGQNGGIYLLEKKRPMPKIRYKLIPATALPPPALSACSSAPPSAWGCGLSVPPWYPPPPSCGIVRTVVVPKLF